MSHTLLRLQTFALSLDKQARSLEERSPPLLRLNSFQTQIDRILDSEELTLFALNSR
jgi:hypothetical protein